MSKMAPTKSGPTNFRSYEAQARLLAAVIATCKPKLDYKGKLTSSHILSFLLPSHFQNSFLLHQFMYFFVLYLNICLYLASTARCR